MTFSAIKSRHVRGSRWLLAAIPCALTLPLLRPAAASAQDRPVFRVEEEVTAFSFSASGRIAYGARHVFSAKKIQLQRDDIWIAEPDGKKRRILLGEKFERGTGPFSYTVRALRWSPDGSKLAVELGTSEMINDEGDTREGVMTLLLDDAGREIQIEGGDSTIPGASNAAWTADSTAVVYLTQDQLDQKPAAGAAPAPKYFTANLVRPSAGEKSTLFAGNKFSAVEWDPAQNIAAAIEPAPNQASKSEPASLVLLDPVRNTIRKLATLEGLTSGLVLSPSGKRVAYWVNNDQLEVRELDSPNRAARVRVASGILAWAKDELRVLVKRGPLRRSGDLVWVKVPPTSDVAVGSSPRLAEAVPEAILHDLEFRSFEISPDGRSLAVVEPGKRNLYVYPLP